MSNLYAERDIIEQGKHYSQHTSAMTSEGLHSKSDIAAELAHRDIQIDQLRARVAELEAYHHAHSDKQAASMPEWIKCSERLPGFGVPVRGFSPEWIDEDFNLDGVRECFRYGDGNEWHTAKWIDEADCYITTDNDVPTLWLDSSQPRQKEQGHE